MKKKPNPELIDNETPELDEAWFANARPAQQMLPEILGDELANEFLTRRTPGRPTTQTPKIFTGIRIDADVLSWFKAQGSGYQTRINQLLRGHMETQHR